MIKVFISYAHGDAHIADEIGQILKRLDISYFRDVKDIYWGDKISSSVKQAITSAGTIIVILSPASIKSQWVPFEVGYATALRKRILPYLTHPNIELPHFMHDLMYISSVEEVSSFFSAQKIDTKEKRVVKIDLEEIEKTVLMMLKENRYVLLDDLAQKVGKTLAETDQIMNHLKRLDLVTARYTDKGKYWELDFDGERIVKGTSDIHPMERIILNS